MKSRTIISLSLVLFFLPGSGSYAAPQWGAPVRITYNGYEEWTHPGTSAIDGNDLLHLCWTRENPDSGGRQIMYVEGRDGSWGEPQAVTPGNVTCYTPDLAVQTNGQAHIVWLEGSGDLGEIHYATDTPGIWTHEQVTNNPTQDISPAVAVDGYNRPHVVWAGYDTSSGEGKIFYAKRTPGGWAIEVLADSWIGDFWTGASPRISVSWSGIVQITYRGGTYGLYHIHQATNIGGEWTIQVLASPNANDFSSSVFTDPYNTCYLAMSGNDGWGFPGRVYHSVSSDGGISWSPRMLATGSYSAAGPVLAADWYGDSHVVWEEVSGNIYTGTIFYSTDKSGTWETDQLTPDLENYTPSISVDGSGGEHVFYVNSKDLVSDSTEVYYITNSREVLSLSLDPRGATVIHRGEKLFLDFTVINKTDSTITADLWFTGIVAKSGVEILLPQAYLNILNPIHGTLPGGAHIQALLVIDTPQNVPTGLFAVVGSLGDRPEESYLDRASVSVRIIE